MFSEQGCGGGVLTWGCGGSAPTQGFHPCTPFKNQIGLLYITSEIFGIKNNGSDDGLTKAEIAMVEGCELEVAKRRRQ
jgi:hypothetical protein